MRNFAKDMLCLQNNIFNDRFVLSSVLGLHYMLMQCFGMDVLTCQDDVVKCYVVSRFSISTFCVPPKSNLIFTFSEENSS